MIVKKKYITEEDLTELIALTAIVPGPSSTQTIVAMGYKMGGPVLALLTMLVWALPAVILMTLLSFMYGFLDRMNISSDGLRLIAPMAVAFIFVASYRIGRKVLTNYLSIILFLLASITTYFIRTPWIFPLLLITGGIITVVLSQETEKWNRVTVKPPYKYVIIFSIIFVLSLLFMFLFDHQIFFIFERFFHYGYLIIGGGQVVIPYMYTDFVEVYQFMTPEEFLTGFGLVQGIPGPMFSFSAYAVGMAGRNLSAGIQILTAMLSSIALFLPGILLIYFIFPIWEQLKGIKAIRIAIKGITAVAAGLIFSAGITLMRESGFSIDNIIVLVFTALILFTKKYLHPSLFYL